MQRVVVRVVLLVMFLLAFSSVALAAGENVWIELEKSSVSPGETVTANVYVADVADLYGASVDFVFDPSVVQMVYQDAYSGWAVPGDIFATVTSSVYEGLVNKADNSQGTFNYATTLLGKPVSEGGDTIPVDLTGKSGLFLSFELRAVGSGEVPFALTSGSNSLINLDGPTTRVNLADSSAGLISYSAALPTTLLVGHPEFWHLEEDLVPANQTGSYLTVIGSHIDGLPFDIKIWNENDSSSPFWTGTATGQYDGTDMREELNISLPSLPVGEYELGISNEEKNVEDYFYFWADSSTLVTLNPETFVAGQNPYTFSFMLQEGTVSDPNDIYLEYLFDWNNWYDWVSYSAQNAESDNVAGENPEGKYQSSGSGDLAAYEDWGIVKAQPSDSNGNGIMDTYQVQIPTNLLVGPFQVKIRDGLGYHIPALARGNFEVEPPGSVYVAIDPWYKFITLSPGETYNVWGKGFNIDGFDFKAVLSRQDSNVTETTEIDVLKDWSYNTKYGLVWNLRYTIPSNLASGHYESVVKAVYNGITEATFEAGTVLVGYPHIWYLTVPYLPANLQEFIISGEMENLPENLTDAAVLIKDNTGVVVASSVELKNFGARIRTDAAGGLIAGKEYSVVVKVGDIESLPYYIEATDAPIIEHVNPYVQKAGAKNFGFGITGYNLGVAADISAQLYDWDGNLLAHSTGATDVDDPKMERFRISFAAEDQVKGVPDGYYQLRIFANNNVEVLGRYEIFNIEFTNSMVFYDIKPHDVAPQTANQEMRVYGWNLTNIGFDVSIYDRENSNYVKEGMEYTLGTEPDGREYLAVLLPALNLGSYDLEIANETEEFYAEFSFMVRNLSGGPGGDPLSIADTSLPGPVQGMAYNYTLTATGGTPPRSWAVISGSLPPGLNLGSTGTISGTPTASGTYTFRAEVTDSLGGKSSREYTVTVGQTGGEYVVTSILINGPDSVGIPAAGSVDSAPFTAIVKDQDGNTIAGEQVTWSLQDTVTGVSITPSTLDNSATLNVESTVLPVTVTLRAVSTTDNTVVGTKQVSLIAENLPTVTVGNATGLPGEIVDIPIKINGFSGITSYGFELQYDPDVLTPVTDGGSNGNILSDGNFSYNSAFSVNSIKAANAQGAVATSGDTLLTIKFIINENTAAGTLTGLNLNLALVFDENNEQLNINVVNGQVEVIDVIYGDVNGDGFVFPNDATYVLKNFVGLEQLNEKQQKAADVNGDGSVFPNDATYILKYFVGLISEFPVEQQ